MNNNRGKYNNNNRSGNNKKKLLWQINNTEKFINPYTFIPAQTVIKEDCTGSEGNLTGFLECSVHIRTPLIIPDPSRKAGKANEHCKYPFFRTGDSCVIPGSEIRGMLRSVYETATDSCFSTAGENAISMRTHDFDAKPGVLKRTGDSYYLYQAESICVDTGINTNINDKYPPKPKGLYIYKIENNGKMKYPQTGKEWDNFDEITVKWFGCKTRKWAGENKDKTKYPDNSNNSEKTGYLLMIPWNGKGTKRYDHIMSIKSPLTKVTEFSAKEIVQRLEKQINDYIDNGGNEKLFKDMRSKIRKKPEHIPVWYRSDNGGNMVYLSFSQQGRKEFINDLYDLLGKFNAVPCKTKKEMCPACRLFGYASAEGGSVSSIRISDAVLQGESSFRERTLAELSSPKISSVEFYLSWNKEKGWWDYDTPGVRIRGRKYYWHHKLNSASETTEKNKRNATHETCESGIFAFKVFFEKITQKELDMLKWCLCLGENDAESRYQHKLGHGKPLGFGSVKITVDSQTLRDVSCGYSIKTSDTPDIQDMSDGISAKALLNVSDSERLNSREQMLVRYPIGEDMKGGNNARASHQWFLGNRSKNGEAKPDKPYINTVLPKYSDINQAISKWEKK